MLPSSCCNELYCYDWLPLYIYCDHFSSPHLLYFPPYYLIGYNEVGAEELRKILSGYGISINLIPVASSGAIKIVEFKKWLKFQRRIDDLETAEAYLPSEIDCPGSNDVVFRPGSSMIENPGNDMFRSLVESKVREVTSDSVSYFTQQKTKDDIAMEIVEEISQRKGRFLRWNNYEGCWAELKDISQVKSKIATTYRDLKLKTKRIRNDLSN